MYLSLPNSDALSRNASDSSAASSDCCNVVLTIVLFNANLGTLSLDSVQT